MKKNDIMFIKILLNSCAKEKWKKIWISQVHFLNFISSRSFFIIYCCFSTRLL